MKGTSPNEGRELKNEYIQKDEYKDNKYITKKFEQLYHDEHPDTATNIRRFGSNTASMGRRFATGVGDAFRGLFGTKRKAIDGFGGQGGLKTEESNVGGTRRRKRRRTRRR